MHENSSLLDGTYSVIRLNFLLSSPAVKHISFAFMDWPKQGILIKSRGMDDDVHLYSYVFLSARLNKTECSSGRVKSKVHMFYVESLLARMSYSTPCR